MEKISLVSNIHHVDAGICVESSALVYIMEPAVKNTVGKLDFFFCLVNFMLGYLSLYSAFNFRDFRINLSVTRLGFQCPLRVLIDLCNWHIMECYKSSYLKFTLSGAQRAARIVSEGAIVQRVNVEVANAHALLLDVNVTQMSAGIVGLGNKFFVYAMQIPFVLFERVCLVF